MTINNMIHLQGERRVIEALADETITPGMLLEQTATGVKKHATAGGFAERMFAQEDALQGKTVADTYAAAAYVSISSEQPGSIINALLLAGSNYTIGTQLISDGAGRLKPTTGTPSQIVAVIVEALDLSASDAVDTLGRARVL